MTREALASLLLRWLIASSGQMPDARSVAEWQETAVPSSERVDFGDIGDLYASGTWTAAMCKASADYRLMRSDAG
jgi:hypothetical protein